MSRRPTRDTTDGRVYLDLQNLARRTHRPTDELHQLYALEGFIDRLSRSLHADNFVLKGALLLAAYDSRRPTRDVDLAAQALDNDAEVVRKVVGEVLQVHIDDGLVFDQSATTAAVIRDGDEYSGVRVTVYARLSAARLQFHVDVNVGDPVTPGPELVALPRLLGGNLQVIGYPLEMVLAEKVVTAVQRGQANTRWRDFVDIARLAAAYPVSGQRLSESMRSVAEHRQVTIEALDEILNGFASIAQTRWSQWRRKLRLDTTTPEDFDELLDRVIAFADPALAGQVSDRIWDTSSQRWI